jgi:hypothetical protein
MSSFIKKIYFTFKCSYVRDNKHFLGLLHIVGPFCPKENKILIAYKWHLYPIPSSRQKHLGYRAILP